MAAESERVVERREVGKEAIATLYEWGSGYTGVWSDMVQRKLVVHAVDYEGHYLILEARKVDSTGAVPNKRRYKVTVTVEKMHDAD